MKFSSKMLLAAGTFLCLGGTVELYAQMKAGEAMRDWYEVFGLDAARRDYDYRLTALNTNGEANIFFPGERPELEFQLRNLTDAPLKGKAEITLFSWGTRNVYGDIWQPKVIPGGEADKMTVEIDVPARGFQNFKIAPKLPEKFGGYALLFDLPGRGRQFMTSIVRALPGASAPNQFPKQSAEQFPAAAMARLGVQAIRFGVPFDVDPAARARTMAYLKKSFDELKKHNIAATIEIGAGQGGYPLNQPRPHLTDDGVMMQTKSDMAWLPQYDGEFGEFCYDIFREYGWPKGPINGVMLWNEPWEGISISGWGADMLRYREMYKVMAEAAHRAGREAGVEVLVGGCDSSSNTFDKFFPDENDEFLKYLDFCSIHYQGLSSPSLYRKWMERKPSRVLIWDTESWVANSEDLLAGVIAANRAAGYDRSMGFFGGYVFGNKDHNQSGVKRARILTEQGEREIDLPLIAYPMASAVAALQNFIGNREFREIMFRRGLPWIFVFDGLEGKAEDGTVVVTGDLTGLFGDNSMYPGLRSLDELRAKSELRRLLPGLKRGSADWTRLRDDLAARFPDRKINDANFVAQAKELLAAPWPFRGVTLELAADGRFALFDMYGNRIEPEKGAYVLPLDQRGHYLRSTAPGGFASLLAALKLSKLSGLVAAELVPRDFLEPVAPGAKLRVTVHNVTNRPLSGRLSGKVGELKMKFPEQLALAPFETREIELEVLEGAPAADNSYPLELVFDAGRDGFAEVRDTMHVNRIAKRTVKVDGSLDDWKGVLPLVVSADPNAALSVMEKAWLPFEKFDAGKSAGVAAVYTAYDRDYFYVAAKVADSTPDPGTLRFETRDDDEFFYPETSYKYDPGKTFIYAVESETPESTARCGVERPDKKGVRAPECIRPGIDRLRLDLSLPEDRLTKVTFYLPWDNFRSNRLAHLYVRGADGRELTGRRQFFEVDGGVFATYEMAGKVAVELVNPRTWHKESGRLAGVFFDAGTPGAKFRLSGGGFARYVGMDESKPGLWQGRFGSEGVLLPGLKYEKLPRGVAAVFRTDDVKETLKWPEGVRRYSYRKRPVLPDGQSPAFDNLQIAFNAIPLEQDPVTVANQPGRMPGFVNYRSTDYEFALNKVAPAYGGGTEIWRMEVPGAFRKHFYPRQPKAKWEGAVKDGKLAFRHDGSTRIIEAAIPWSEIPHVKALMEAGRPVKFSFRVNDNGGPSMEFGRDRAATRKGGSTFHPDWKTSYTNEIEFAFEK